MSFSDIAKATFKEIFQTAFISLLIFFVVYVFLVQPHRVKGESMVPNFNDGELLLTEKVTYRIYKPARGDVVVFKAPGSQNVDFIKRVIGLSGENVKVRDGFVYINDQKLSEQNYEVQQTLSNYEVTLGNDQYFVLGDNRGASSDSRVFGPIDKGRIEGKAWLVYWPAVKNGKYAGFRIISSVDYGIPNTLNDR